MAASRDRIDEMVERVTASVIVMRERDGLPADNARAHEHARNIVQGLLGVRWIAYSIENVAICDHDNQIGYCDWCKD